MELIHWEASPKLSRPLLLVAFEGWFDAGGCATGALDWLLKTAIDAEKVAEIDLEEFLDFQETRPVARTYESKRIIEWPVVDCHAIKDSERHHLVLLQGPEPRMRWRSFNEAILKVAETMKCQMIVTMGATAVGVPHSRPPTVKSSAGNATLATRLGLTKPTYQGPTGVIGILHDMADKANMPVVSMRVGVPHYVAGPQNPKGTQALLAEFEQVTGVLTNHTFMDDDVELWESRVTEAVESEPEVMAYISQLEDEVDRAAAQRRAEEGLPSGDDLAAQIEQFLQERNAEEGEERDTEEGEERDTEEGDPS